MYYCFFKKKICCMTFAISKSILCFCISFFYQSHVTCPWPFVRRCFFYYQHIIRVRDSKMIYTFCLQQKIKFRDLWPQLCQDSLPSAASMWSKSRPKAWRCSGSSPDPQSPRQRPFWKPTAVPIAPSAFGETNREGETMTFTDKERAEGEIVWTSHLWKCDILDGVIVG